MYKALWDSIKLPFIVKLIITVIVILAITLLLFLFVFPFVASHFPYPFGQSGTEGFQ